MAITETYICTLYGYNKKFAAAGLYPYYPESKETFSNLANAVDYALTDKKARHKSKHYGGANICKNSDSGIYSVLDIDHTGKIEAVDAEAKQALAAMSGAKS